MINDPINGNQELVSSVNKQALYIQSFISFCNTFFLIITIEQNMHDKNKDTKSFTELRKYLLNGYFFDSIAKSRIQNPIKSLWWSFFAKIIQWLFQTGFFHLGDRIKVAGSIRQVVVLYSKDCKGICLDGLSIGRL